MNAENRYGVKPLSMACVNGDVTLVKLLLEAGADANSTLRGGETVLMTAARTGKIGAVDVLRNRGADVNAKERHGQTAIMWAAADGHVEVVDRLIQAGAEFLVPLKSGYTLLFFAVRAGHADVVKAILAAGADVNETMEPQRSSVRTPRYGTSPLVLTVENGHFDLATILLAMGADANDQRSGFTPLHTLTWVRKPNSGDGIDGEAAPRGSGRMSSMQFVRELVAHGADVNARLKRGSTPQGALGKVGATPFLMAAATDDAPLMPR